MPAMDRLELMPEPEDPRLLTTVDPPSLRDIPDLLTV